VRTFQNLNQIPNFVYAASLSIASKSKLYCDRRQYNGVRAAKAVGIYWCRYNSIHSKAQDLSEADVIINHFAELNLLHLFNPN
jgi:hypothetical protein